jgi:cysteine desulfurase / selenocysteine lyase
MPHSILNISDLIVDGAAWTGKTYLNTAAEGLLLKDAATAVHQYLADKSTGEPGRVPMWAALERARERAGRLFGVPASRMAIVSSTTEALNTIAQGIDWRPGDEVVFTSVEFPSNMFPWVVLPERGVKTRIVAPRDGLVRLEDILEQITPQTRLVTLSQVSYATGQHIDPTPIWERVKNTKTLLCVDATQAAARVNVSGEHADFVVSSCFKWMNSIHGAAILSASTRVLDQGVRGPAGWLSAESCYAADRLERFHPRKDAGRFHAGMPNFDSVYSLAAALDFHTPERVAARRAELEYLVNRAWTGLKELGMPVLTPASPADRAGIVAMSCPTSEAVKRHLAERNIFIHGDDSRVRAAIHWYTTAEQIDCYLAAVKELLC